MLVGLAVVHACCNSTSVCCKLCCEALWAQWRCLPAPFTLAAVLTGASQVDLASKTGTIHSTFNQSRHTHKLGGPRAAGVARRSADAANTGVYAWYGGRGAYDQTAVRQRRREQAHHGASAEQQRLVP